LVNNNKDRKIFRSLITYQEAQDKLYSYINPKERNIEELDLWDTIGKVTAVSIFANHDVPPFDRCAMDGFAILAEDVYQASEQHPIKLKIIDRIKAGQISNKQISKSDAIEVATGTSLPVGANAVVMVEDTFEKDQFVYITNSVVPGENIQSAGSDIQLGELVIERGRLLQSTELSKLSALGISKVKIYKIPKIAIFSSGDEIIPFFEKLKPGKIHDVNSTTIYTQLKQLGIESEFLGILTDEEYDMKKNLSKVVDKYDVIIISGGTSAGVGDILYKIIDEIGKPGIIAHGLKVKPGKPTIIGIINKTCIFGLPGYPTSALSIFLLLIKPFLMEKIGLPQILQQNVKGILTTTISSELGRHEFKAVRIIKWGEKILIFPNKGSSATITLLTEAHGILEINESVTKLPKGKEVEISMIVSYNSLPNLQFIVSHDIALEKIIDIFNEEHDLRTHTLVTGSTGGLLALKNKECHIATAHLLDYSNYIKDKFICFEGYKRIQGLIVKNGNPLNIKSIHDLTRKDVKFINRNHGSGTRILIDKLLKDNSLNPEDIMGFNYEASSHSVVASAIKENRADVGLAIQSIIDTELEFIPLITEDYDFFILQENIKNPNIILFQQFLKSSITKNVINKFLGYQVSSNIGEVKQLPF
jgi:putative molybdopterin biosynthesis protein